MIPAAAPAPRAHSAPRARLWLWLCLLGSGACLDCVDERLAYSIAFDRKVKEAKCTPVVYNRTKPILLQHPCSQYHAWAKKKISVYLGEDVFVSMTSFETSLIPLCIPEELEAPTAVVSDIAFVYTDSLLMVINSRVYTYFKNTNKWVRSAGVSSPVSELSNVHCCYQGKESHCKEISWTVFAYDVGHSISNSPIFQSQDGGHTFTRVVISRAERGVLLGVYNFISLGLTGLLINRTEEESAGKAAGAYFRYFGSKDQHASNYSSPTFHVMNKFPDKLWSIHSLGLRGFIILWSTDVLLVSSNNGLIMDEVSVFPTSTFENSTFPRSGYSLVTISGSEIAVLTQDKQIFYGSISLVTTMVYIATDKTIDLNTTVMLFEERGWLTLLSPVISNFSKMHDFKKCKFNLQLAIWRSHQSCDVEILEGNFQNKIYYIDMHENLTLNATFVRKPGKKSVPLVTVSNPHALAFSATILEIGFTYDGNTEYLLNIGLQQQFFSGFAVRGFCAGLLDGEISTVTVDIPDKGIGCIDLAPLTALIEVSCPPTKHIRIFKNITACDKELFQEAVLKKNFSYTISHDVYDPQFLARPNIQQDDLQINYDFKNLGCPLLVYYKNPWVPILELWQDGKFQKQVSAEFVMFEINGMFNYDYLLTANDANCFSQPQNWTTLLERQASPDPNTAWTRRNYVSCKNMDGPELKWPSVKYQVLGGGKNKIIFPPYNGLYIFKAIVVDTFYSYCDLTVTFPIYVYGAFPRSYLKFQATLIGFAARA
ncbi:PREDICTED: cation channel sperm-associated protein subunit delta [Tinamus guttatus]|uniref:cation channel sperm-associated protein subunit delta n=1 Tax=Tinamus guttatus TaxID=94827 RepID=UPI00052EAC8B|nr:PREDICTED: cation channel sperm-associated protein subunit delta [Tinamus guttatus]